MRAFYTTLLTRVGLNTPVVKLTAIVGEAGSGKTVYAKALMLHFVKKGLFPFFLDFLSLSFQAEALTFVELIKNSFPNFDFENSGDFGAWICANAHRCAFVLDGLDQATFSLTQKVSPVNVRAAASVRTWISLLFSRRIMSKSRVVFTSRLPALLHLSFSLRPKLILRLRKRFSYQYSKKISRAK